MATQRQTAARKLLKPEVANDKSLYPDADTINKGEWQNDVGDASRLYEEYYQKLKAADKGRNLAPHVATP